MSFKRSVWAIALVGALVGCETQTGGDDGDVVDDDNSGVQPKIPAVSGICPLLYDGVVMFGTSTVQIYKGPTNKKGPLLLYWHATAMTFLEVLTPFQGAINEVRANGGMVASFYGTNFLGFNTGDWVWYTGDIMTADQVVACGVQQGIVDPKRIYTSGYSAGGLQCGAMVNMRSSYIAGGLCMSGGEQPLIDAAALGTLYRLDSANPPPVIGAHGPLMVDYMIIDMFTSTTDLLNDMKRKGSPTVIDCADMGDHLAAMNLRAGSMGPAAWRFWKENPYGAKKRYSSVPSYFPMQCRLK